MTNKEYRIEPASTLQDVGIALQKGFDEGYRVSEGWPVQIGWYYEVKMEKDLEVVTPPEEKRKAGRPPQK
jgi:hypothetical protein